MKKNSITNKITPCCNLPFPLMYWWVSNITLNTEAERQFIISTMSQSGVISVDAWKVLINSGTLESDAALTKEDFISWFECKIQPSCEQLKLIIEGFKVGNYDPSAEYGVGWTETYIIEEYNGKLIKKITGYTGGIGVLPDELNDRIGLYLGDGILTDNKDLATDFKGESGSNGTASIPKWSAQNYAPNAMVIDDNFIQYIAPNGATASDIPGKSDKWIALRNFCDIISIDNLYPLQSGNYDLKLAIKSVPENLRRLTNSIRYIDDSGIAREFYFIGQILNAYTRTTNWVERTSKNSIIAYVNSIPYSKQLALRSIKSVTLNGVNSTSQYYIRSISSVTLVDNITKTVDIANSSGTVVSRATITYNFYEDYGISIYDLVAVGTNGYSGTIEIDISELQQSNITSSETSLINGGITLINRNSVFLQKETVKVTDSSVSDGEVAFTSTHNITKRITSSTKRVSNLEAYSIFTSKINLAFPSKDSRMSFVNMFKGIRLLGNYKSRRICLYTINFTIVNGYPSTVTIFFRDIITNAQIASSTYTISENEVGCIVDVPIVQHNSSGISGYITIDTSITVVNKLGANFNNEHFEIVNIQDLNTGTPIGSVNWGNIGGNISYQNDLNNSFQKKLIAGANISITETGEISATSGGGAGLPVLNRISDINLSSNEKFQYGNFIIDRSLNVLNNKACKLQRKSYEIINSNYNELTLCQTSDGKYYGVRWLATQDKNIKVSTDLTTWTNAFNVGAYPTGIFELSDGELLITTQHNGTANLPTDTGVWRTKNKRTEAEQVLQYTTPYSSGVGTVVVPEWGVSIYDNIVVLLEYGDRAALGSNGGVFLSTDYGKTFIRIFDLIENTLNGFLNKSDDTINRIHLHGCCYDPYFKRIWFVTGDSTEFLVWSDDLGVTWDKLDLSNYNLDGNTRTLQFINLIALQDYIILCTDGDLQSLFRIQRGIKSQAPVIEEAYRFDEQTNCYHFVSDYHYDEHSGLLYIGVGFGDGRIPTEDKYKHSFILCTSDGINFNKIWECNYLTEYSPKRLRMFVRFNDILIEQLDNKGLQSGYSNKSRYIITKPKYK